MRRWSILLAVAMVPIFLAAVRGQQDLPKNSRYEFRKDHDPDGIGKFYMGREIAQVMGHLGAGWLERPEREKEEQPSKLLPPLKIKPGDVGRRHRRRQRLLHLPPGRRWSARRARSTPSTSSRRCSTSSGRA